MRFAVIAATILVLSLIACNSPRESTPEIGPQDTLTETPEVTEPSPSDAPVTPKSPENILVETPEYTGIIFSEDGASEFSPILGSDVTGFWEPSIDDVSEAEEQIRKFLVSLHDDPKLGTYQRENVEFILNNLGEYRRQYVGILVDGEKRIWCNLFFSGDRFPNWKRAPVAVLDGGNHFWQIEYILLKDTCVNFYVHGEG